MKNKFLLFLSIFIIGFTTQAQIVKKPANKSQVFNGIVKTIIFEDQKDNKKYFLDTGERLLPLRSIMDNKLVNAKVSITGKLDDENYILPEEINVLKSANTGVNIPVADPYKVLVLPLNFQNDTSQPVPIEQIRYKIFTDTLSTRRYYQQVSNGKLNLIGNQNPEGDVLEYITLPFTNKNCNLGLVTNEWASAADRIAFDRGIDVNSYQSVIYLFNGDLPHCNAVFATRSEVGDRTTTNRIWWVNAFSDFNIQYFQFYITHEIGHNLGLNHSSGFRNCPWTVSIETCTDVDEYGDRADVMGYFGYNLLNNYNRLRLGWLNGKIKVYDKPDTYYINLFSPSHPTKRTTLAQIRLKDLNGKFTGKSFFLEFRRNLPPFDIFREGDDFPYPPIQSADKGVTIRYGSENVYENINRSYLIDTVPDTPDFGDAALLPGYVYNNTYYGVKISTIYVNPFFGARVKIEINP